MRRHAFSLVVSFALAVCAGNGVNPVTNEVYPLPVPVAFSADMDAPVPFDAATTVVVEGPGQDAVRWVADHFVQWYGAQAPRVVSGTAGLQLRAGDEAYAVSAGKDGVKLAARTLAGVRWAVYTLR